MKMYKAISPETCIVRFSETLEPGWYASNKEARSAYAPASPIAPVAEPDILPAHDEAPKRRGRPRRAEMTDTDEV